MSTLLDPILTVIRFNQAFNDRDVVAMMQLMAHNCVFENTYPPPNGTRYEGQDAVRAFWEEFFANSRDAHIEIEDIFAAAQHCVMRWCYQWVDQNGQPGQIRGVDIYTVGEEGITEKLSYVKG
jgi:ketosteroid isomerase-like protein